MLVFPFIFLADGLLPLCSFPTACHRGARGLVPPGEGRCFLHGFPHTLYRCDDDVALKHSVNLTMESAYCFLIFSPPTRPPSKALCRLGFLHNFPYQDAEASEELFLGRIRFTICHVSSCSHAFMIAMSSSVKSSSRAPFVGADEHAVLLEGVSPLPPFAPYVWRRLRVLHMTGRSSFSLSLSLSIFLI